MGSVCLACVTRRNNEEGTLGYNRNLNNWKTRINILSTTKKICHTDGTVPQCMHTARAVDSAKKMNIKKINI
jgi:hypothetical protein